MRKTKHIMSGIFTMAIALLFFAQCNNKEANVPTGDATEEKPLAQYLPIAYVDYDSVLIHFNYYSKLMNAYETKLSKQNNALNRDYQKFQEEVQNFQQKAQNNAFLTQERAVQEETRLQRLQQNLEKQAAQIEQELALDQKVLQQQLSDSLTLGIKEFNTPQKYQMILTKSGNAVILYADEHYNITNEVIDFLNNRFISEE